VATVQGGTETVPAGTTSLVILGTFVAPYEVGVLPGWATDKFVLPADKLASQFTVSFPIPAPSGASLDWSVLDSA
jgi:hypothetical protein